MSNKIGVMMSDNLGLGLAHEFFSKVVSAFRSYCEEQGYLLCFFNESAKYMIQHSFLDQINEDGYDGIFIANVKYDMPEVQEVLKSGKPIVTIDYKTEGAISVSSDNIYGIQELVNYVCVERKHRKVAYIVGDQDSEVTKIRLKAFTDTCEACGVNVRPEYIRQSRFKDIRDVTRRTEELLNLQDPPTCIFFPDDYAAIGGINVIHNRGLEVPRDISYCGYDGVNIVSLLDPQICTVVQDTDTMGVTAASELIKMINEKKTGDGSEIIVPTKLQIGHTVSQINF